MSNEKKCPEYLYRGMCIRYDDFKDFILSGVDMKLPYDPYIDKQGRETVHDGNEYGIYMSDNPKVVKHSYGNSTNTGSGTYINPPLVIGGRNDYIMLPDVGVCYKISTQNLNVRIPWIRNELKGVYNNGFNGNEWITDKIPAENYEIIQVMIGKDMLHDAQYMELDDMRHLKEKTTLVLEQRKSRLEIFSQEMSKIPETKRKNFSLTDFGVFKEIYGENGFRYMSDFDEIDISTDIGIIRYLMAKVYDNDRVNIDFSTLAKLQDIKERIMINQKRGKTVDIKQLINNEELIDMIEQRESKNNRTF